MPPTSTLSPSENLEDTRTNVTRVVSYKTRSNVTYALDHVSSRSFFLICAIKYGIARNVSANSSDIASALSRTRMASARSSYSNVCETRLPRLGWRLMAHGASMTVFPSSRNHSEARAQPALSTAASIVKAPPVFTGLPPSCRASIIMLRRFHSVHESAQNSPIPSHTSAFVRHFSVGQKPA